jgi:hypothetical protein
MSWGAVNDRIMGMNVLPSSPSSCSRYEVSSPKEASSFFRSPSSEDAVLVLPTGATAGCVAVAGALAKGCTEGLDIQKVRDLLFQHKRIIDKQRAQSRRREKLLDAILTLSMYP